MKRYVARISVLLLVAAAGPAFSACGDPPPTTITDVRTLEAPRAEVPEGAPDWHRFDLEPPRHSEGPAPSLAWDLPEGWAFSPTPARPYNFVLEGVEGADAYLSALPRRQGTVADNVDRWRGQMGLEPGGPQAVAALPKEPLFGTDATFVDLAGTYRPMGGGEPKADWRLLGLVLEAPDMYVFFKMVGPAAALEARRGEFLALAASFRREARPAPAAPRGTKQASDLSWTTPPGWVEQGGSGMREVTFQVEGTNASCWVLFLGGSAGGLPANVNRWLGEVGRKPLAEAEIARLPRLDVLGTQGVLVEGEGDYRGMGGPAIRGALLFGLVCPLAGRTLFVKMVGAAQDMRKQRENFEALCTSLRLAP